MNVQNRINEYCDWGFSPLEIIERVNLDYVDENYVNNALNSYKKGYEGYHTKISRIKERTGEKVLEWGELLWRYDPEYVNTEIKARGITGFARFLHITPHIVYNMKRYFGIHNDIPSNARVLLGYVPSHIRMEVDKLDNNRCIRCNKDNSSTRLDYHIINIEVIPNIDNVVTLCAYCHKYYIHQQCEKQRGVNFNKYNRKSLEKFIKYYYNISIGYFKPKYKDYELKKHSFCE